MKITSIAYSAPSKSYSNEEFADLFRDQLTGLSADEKSMYHGLILKMLNHTGAEHRYMRDIEKGETAYEHILGAMKTTLENSGLKPEEIDLVIYCGVGKGFIEPSNSYLYAREMKMFNAECFDVVDACMSWTRTMQICQNFLKAGTYSNIMVVTGEFHLGLRDTNEIKNVQSLEYNFPMYTIGETATATIVEASGQDWDFTFLSKPEFADLCTIPLEGYETFLPPSARIGLNGPGKFVSFGKDLLGAASPLLTELIRTSFKNFDDVKLFIPHAPSKTVYLENLIGIGN